ncbi:unnamed protein product [Cylindrotheca closterium]|uniref:N(6)-L-threonylcarbamoyladenine synthase n=1 Tax=Cylindrotheca closterium TaxID=2856 RepID=A0AAD2FFC0_9STRA|nr:unnamed protein product [Cylindrotheca closterium]
MLAQGFSISRRTATAATTAAATSLRWRLQPTYNRPLSSTSSESSSESSPTTESDEDQQHLIERLKRKQAKAAAKAKAKRQKFLGLAKAVDRGQFSVTYQPGGPNGDAFQNKSGLPTLSLPFTVLGIESSCDDTGAAVVRSDGIILGEALASQAEIHEEWGGVVPGLAKTAHEENLDQVIELALSRANLTIDEVDAIGVTVGPGLEICLRVGCNRAKELAIQHKKPFVGIHHLEAHILMARLENPDLQFPFLSLLVSGGHCQILKCMGIGRYSVIGGTLDDSLGEAFDKTARLLGLPVGGGGGPAVEKLALEGNRTAVPLTVPLLQRKDCDFSYAGLKTNVRRAAEKLVMERGVELPSELPRGDKADIAASFQHIAIRHLEHRLKRAISNVEDEEIKTLALVGGVAANMELRSRLEELCENHGWSLAVPPPRLCTDQGAMSAWAAVERLKLGSSDEPDGQDVYARYPFSLSAENNQDS